MNARLIGRTGPASGIDFMLGEMARLGAAASSELRIPADGVSRTHARVFQDGDEFWVEDAGSTNGTFVNGQRVSKTRLQHLDVLTLGRHVDLIFLRRGDENPTTETRDSIETCTLEFADGPEAGTTVEVPKGEITIGRAAVCNVMITTPLVSKVHAKLTRTSDAVTLQDLESANGTFVNGKRIEGRIPLQGRDVVSIAGARTLRVVLRRDLSAAPQRAVETDTSTGQVFDQDWRTRLVWSPEELLEIEAERAAMWQQAGGPAIAAAVGAPPPPAPVQPLAQPAVALSDVSAGRPDTHEVGTHVPGHAERAAPQVSLPGGIRQAAAAARGGASKPESPVPPPAAVPAHEVGTAVSPGARSKPRGADRLPAALANRAATARGGGADEATERASSASDSAPPPRPVLEGAGPAPRGAIGGLALDGSAGHFQLGVGEYSIGRGPESAICIDSRQVSRHHATLIVTTLGASVVDHESANGTFVNGTRVEGRAPLQHGDLIGLSSVELRVTLLEAQ